ncbi:MAG: metallophosphoesterase [Erysipelotrichaceae bacterium]|nr:metallophosphoesterase [Erysipelotrichaceae bacterium]
MADFQEMREHYINCYKKAKKKIFKDRISKIDPYLLALDEIVDVYSCSQVKLGEIEVPADLIVGTKTSARKESFSRDFMPLIKEGSEFSFKWIQVCKYHLSDTGISDAPKAYEYLGKFYIEEGNKRVSVLKSYGAVFIPCDVTRLVPTKNNDLENKLYYEFLDYYKYSRLYSIQFKKLGYYKKLQKLMEFEEDHEWERMERIRLVGFYGRLCDMLKKKKIDVYYPDSLVVLMEIYGYKFLYDMTDKELSKAIDESKTRIINDKAHFNILCVADDEDNGLWNGYSSDNLKNYDLILSAGDLKSEYLEYLVTVSNKPLYYVHGNHDESYDTKPPLGCECLDDELITYRGLRILGLGGSYKYKDDAKYMYNEKQMKSRIRKLKPKIKKAGGVDIVVAHAPIKGYGDLDDYAHQGFECFIDLIKAYKPKYFIYGHVHHTYNYKDTGFYKIDDTQIINVSGKQRIVY